MAYQTDTPSSSRTHVFGMPTDHRTSAHFARHHHVGFCIFAGGGGTKPNRRVS